MPPVDEKKARPGLGDQGVLLKIGILVLAVILVLVGVGGIYFYLSGSSAAVEDDVIDMASSNRVGDFWPPVGRNARGLEVAGNLQGKDAAAHFSAAVQFELKYMNDPKLRAKALEEVAGLEPWIADVCRRKLAARTESQINNEAEQERIKEEIMQVLNQRLQIAQVRDVVFRELLTQ